MHGRTQYSGTPVSSPHTHCLGSFKSVQTNIYISPLKFEIFTYATGQRKVYWQNLREEPIVFINGQPFVVRESDQPFSNLEYTGW